jgi:hypothetical protein
LNINCGFTTTQKNLTAKMEILGLAQNWKLESEEDHEAKNGYKNASTAMLLAHGSLPPVPINRPLVLFVVHSIVPVKNAFQHNVTN